jgi:hypothetical protein
MAGKDANPKRNIRVMKWLGTVPVVGVCSNCNREFKVSLTALARPADAQESLRRQFSEHKCQPIEQIAGPGIEQ